jgi:TonB family protein
MATYSSDIFISYARTDKAIAKLLADSLATQGWRVWWDRDILPGESFAETIERALDSSACVIVLWSKTSIASGWVKTEAAEGLSRGILIPALIENVKIPLEFRRIETANLSDWQGSASHPEYCEMLDAIGRMIRQRATGDLGKESEEEAARKAAEEAAKLLAEEQARQRAEEERKQAEAERLRQIELEARERKAREEEAGRREAAARAQIVLTESSESTTPVKKDREQLERPTLGYEPPKTGVITRLRSLVEDHARLAAGIAVMAIIIVGALVVWLMQSNGDQRTATNTPAANINQFVASIESKSSPTPTVAKSQSPATVDNHSQVAQVPSDSNATPASGRSSPTPTSARPSPTAPSAVGPPPPKTTDAGSAGRGSVSGGVLNGKAISLPKPAYPAVARAGKASGVVQVTVLIDEDGNVVSARAVSGHPLLYAAAAGAARQAKFTPTKVAGQPVKVSGVIVYNFIP